MASGALDDRGIVTACLSRRRIASVRTASAPRHDADTASNDLHLPAPIEVSRSADFDRLIAASTLPVVVDYWAPWCGPCRMVAPELEKVATRLAGRVVVVKVNTDALPDLGERFGIRSIPTLAVFAGGREVTRTTGARPAKDIEALIESAVAKQRA